MLLSDWSDAGGLTVEKKSSLLQRFVSSLMYVRRCAVHKLTIATLADETKRKESQASYCEPGFSAQNVQPRWGITCSLAGPDVPGKGTSGHYCQHSVDYAGMLACPQIAQLRVESVTVTWHRYWEQGLV